MSADQWFLCCIFYVLSVVVWCVAFATYPIEDEDRSSRERVWVARMKLGALVWPVALVAIGVAVGARWVRRQVRIATGRTTDPLVVARAARALHAESQALNGVDVPWDELGAPQRESWQSTARAALVAAGALRDDA